MLRDIVRDIQYHGELSRILSALISFCTKLLLVVSTEL